MNDTIFTGIFTIIGVILGGCMSFFTTIHIEKKTHSSDVLKIKEQIILEKQKIITYRNILVKMIQDELNIKPKVLQSKLNVKKTDTYFKKELKRIIKSVDED